MMNNENIVSVILQDISGLILGDRYRFCLVLLQEKNIKRDLVVGCSNITKLEAFENSSLEDYNYNNEPTSDAIKKNKSDIVKFEKVDSRNNTDNHVTQQSSLRIESNTEKFENDSQQQPSSGYQLLSNMSGSFLPGLAAGIFVTSLFVLIWGATKIRSERHRQMTNPSITTCYMASNNDTLAQIIDVPESDRGNQYLKLQATTNL